MRIALFAGSFNPFTIGHQDIVLRGLQLFDRVIVAVGTNAEKAYAAPDLDAIRACFADEPRVEVRTYSGLTTDFAQEVGATALLRSVRSVKDYEYERDMAAANYDLSGIETVLLFSKPEYAHISSSLVRELRNYGRDVSHYLPR